MVSMAKAGWLSSSGFIRVDMVCSSWQRLPGSVVLGLVGW